MRHADSVEITGTRSPKGSNSQATTTRIPSSAHKRLSSVAPELSTVDGMASYWNKKNVALSILKVFAGYHSIIIPSCYSRFPRKWKLISIIVPTSYLSTRRSKCWERNSGVSQQKMKPSLLELDERNCIGGSARSYPRSSANGSRSNRAKSPQTPRMKHLRSRVFQATLTAFALWIHHVIGWNLRFSSTLLSAVRKAVAHFRI